MRTILLAMLLLAPVSAWAQQTTPAEQKAVDFMGALSTVCDAARPAIAGWANEVRQSEMAQQQQSAALAQYWADYVKGIEAKMAEKASPGR